jgi:hypothetical protein
MNWKNWLQIVFSLTPYIVAGVEKIAGDNASGATKKQMATDALGIATAGAEAVDPNDASITQAASNVTGLIIDSTVNDNKTAIIGQVIDHHVAQFNASGSFAKTPAAAAPAPAPVATSTAQPGPGVHAQTPA